MPQRLLVLDRDGVINYDSDAFITSPEEWHPIPGSLQAISRACKAGFRVVVASNQSGLARGHLDVDALNAIHARLQATLAEVGGSIDAFFFCPHGPDDACACRKPSPGMLVDIARRLRVPLRGVPVVGDRIRDLEAARAVGARPILVRTGRGASEEPQARVVFPELEAYDDLAAAVDALIGR